MSKILLESGIIILLVLIGISIFIPSSDNANNVIVEFENSIENGDIINDGKIENVEITPKDEGNFISRLNEKIANTIVNGLNSILELGISFLRKAIN